MDRTLRNKFTEEEQQLIKRYFREYKRLLTKRKNRKEKQNSE